jgi:putative ABC transport system permease protein
VVAEGIASRLPQAGWNQFEAELQQGGRQRLNGILANAGYFRALELKPVAGRLFQDDERTLVVVNQSFAARYWPDDAAVGKRLRLISSKSPEWLSVAGVVPDVLQDFRDPLARHPLLYVPFAMAPEAQVSIVARTAVPPTGLAQALRGEIQNLDANLPLFDVRTLESRIGQNRLEKSIFGSICTVFAAIALVLATVGLYSVIAHSVSIRSQEIGLRMAMGATRRDIVWMVFVQGMRPLLIGLVIGVPLALVAMRALRSAMIGVSPGDPWTFLIVIAVLLEAGVLGCAIPARRATRVDPVVALRCQ